MKTPVSTEPGLLAVFRLFTGLQFVIDLSLLVAAGKTAGPRLHTVTAQIVE